MLPSDDPSQVPPSRGKPVLNLSILQHADSAFPSGSFAFSGGVEGLAAMVGRLDVAGLAGILELVLRHRWAGCERVTLVQAWRQGPEPDRLAAIDRALEAATLPATLRTGSRRNGSALLATHRRLETPGAAAMQTAIAEGRMLGHLAPIQGALWRSLGIAEADAVMMSAYTTLTALTSATVRLNALGALAVQAALSQVLPLIGAYADTSDISGETALTGALPWLDLACARQEVAELRLFSN